MKQQYPQYLYWEYLRNNTRFAFTLVELLVVMTIVAILATVSAIYVFWNFADSRDAVRLTDFWNIQTSMDTYYSSKWRYPDPDNAIDVIYSWSTVWTQWVFWKEVAKALKTFWTITPTDPKFENFYSYSITNKASEYQIGGVLEWDENEEGLWELTSIFIDQAHADVMRALVSGKYNNFVVRTSTWGIDYYIATPSIISSELYVWIDVVDVITSQRLVYNDFFNLPASYSEQIDTLWWFNFNVSDPIVFSGTSSELKTQEWLQDFWNNLKYTYATTPTESFDIFRRILDSENTTTVLKNFLGKHFKIRFRSAFDCRDIYDSWELQSGSYKIDPDGDGPKSEETVYCDMDTWGGWWTKKNIQDFSNWDFVGGNHISSLAENIGSSVVNLWTTNTPITSGYALRQNTASSYYKIWLQNQLEQIADLEIWDELRLSLWLRDDADASANSWSSCTSTICSSNPSAWYAFSNVLYGNDGLNSVNGFAQTTDTMTTADGNTWRKQVLRKKITRQIDDFEWFIGRGFWATKDIYITGVEIEVYYWGYESFD